MAKKFKPTTKANSKINESVDISVKESVRSKIINYAQQRLNKSGAVLLAPVYDIINFNDPLDGMISFDYLNTIAENEELSEEESGYDYIEQAVTDIANFIQNQGYIMDEESDDPLIFIDENYDEAYEDEELEDMNEATSIKKSDRYREFDLLPKGKGWMDPIELTNKDAGFYAIAGTMYDKSDRDNEDEWGIVVILAPLDEKYEDVVITGSFYDYDPAAEGIMDRLSRAKTPSDVARIIKNQDFYDDDGDDESGFLAALTKSFGSQNESTMMINESARIKPCNPELEGFDLLDANNPFDFEPVDLMNEELGFYAIAGVATGMGGDFDEDDCSIEVCVTALALDSIDEVLVAEYYDMDYKAMSVMEKLAKATTFPELANILHTEGFQGMNGDYSDFVEELTKLSEMNEATEVPDGRMTVELDDTDVIEGDTLLLAELTDDVFNAVNTVLDELDPDADVEITIDNEDLLQLAVVSDEDLDDDAFDQVLSELLEDMDLEDIVADMTDSEPIEDPEDEDFGRVIQYINFYPATGATVVPDNSVMEDNIDVIEDEDVINESFKLNTDLTKFVDNLADSFFGSIKDANFLNLEDEDGNLYFQVSTGDKSYSRKLLTNFLAFLAKKNVDFDLVNKVNVTGNSTFYNATVTVKINNKQGSQVQYRNEINESTDALDNSRRISHYVDDLNFKSGVKFLEGDDKIEKVLKAISPKLDIRSYNLDKLPWTTYTIDGKDKVAVFGISGRLFTPMAIAITDGKNISDFINNSKSILAFTNKKLEDWNNVVIPVRIMNNLAKVTDRASEYKAIKSLLDKYEKQVYNYEQYDESYSINKAAYKDADEDLSIDKTTATKVLKVINTILTKAGRPLDNLDKVFRINYPRPGIIEDGLVLALKSTYGIGNEAHDLDTKVERRLEKSFDITYKTNRGKKDYYVTDKFRYYSQSDIEKYFKTGKVRDYDGQMSILNAKEDIVDNAIDDITEFVESHPKYKLNLWKYDSVDDDGHDSIKIVVETKDVNDAKEILIDTDNYIAKNHKELYHYVEKNPTDKKYPYLDYTLDPSRNFGEGIKVQSNYYVKGNYLKTNESVDDLSEDMNEATKVTFRYDDQKDLVSPEDFKKIEKFAPKMEDALESYLRRLRDLGPDDKLKDQVYTEISVENKEKIIIETKTKNKVLKKDIDKLWAKGNGPSPSTNFSQLPLDEVKATTKGIAWGISPIDKSLVVKVYTGFKSLSEPWDPAKAKAEWDAAHPKKPASALKSKLEEFAKGIEKYVKSHPDYKKFNLSKDVVHVGEDYIQITVETPDVEVGKSILIDTDKFISKNYKDLETHSKSKDGSKPVWSVYVMKSSAAKDLMNESTKTPTLPTQSELKTIIQKSMIKFGERHTQVTVHAYRTSKYEGGVVDVDLDGTSLATDGREEDYYDEDNIKNALEYAAKELVDKFGQDKDVLDYIDVTYNKVGSLTITFSLDSELNESTNYKKFANKLETFINDEIDTIYDEMVVSVDETGYGYNINVTFDNRLLGSNPSKIISKIVDFIVERNGKYSDLVHYNNKVTGDYKLVFSYKGQLNECAIIGPDETDIDTLRANELSRALSSEQPLVDPYDIRCTIRPVFVRKDQFLFDGSTVYKATANASTDKDAGTTEIKVDVLLSNDPDVTDASTTLTLPTEFDGLKLLRGNPTKVYNESADVKADTVTLSFANEDEANEFIKDNGVKPEKSFEGKFGWTVILKKSDLKKIK